MRGEKQTNSKMQRGGSKQDVGHRVGNSRSAALWAGWARCKHKSEQFSLDRYSDALKIPRKTNDTFFQNGSSFIPGNTKLYDTIYAPVQLTYPRALIIRLQSVSIHKWPDQCEQIMCDFAAHVFVSQQIGWLV